MIQILAVIIRILWLVIEVPYLRRFRVPEAQDWDKRSALLWDIANAVEVVGLVFALVGFGSISLPQFISILALFILSSGILIRFIAIRTLGRFFTCVVTIRTDQRIVDTGLYKYVRHPSYTGALLAHAGLGLAFGSWISLALSTIPFLIAALYRMRVEEAALKEVFGDEYSRYVEHTERLIPGIF